MPETAISQTPYVRARQEWDERFGDQIKSKNNWRLAAFIAMGTTFVCVTGMVAIGYRSNTVPYVVALDDVGRAVPVIPAKQVAVKDVRLQEAVVARWVTNLRTVIADAVAQRRLVDEVYAETGQNSPASATITEFYSKNSPFDLLTKETVDASVESIVQQSPKTYEVAWTEVTRDLSGKLMSRHTIPGLRFCRDAGSDGCKAGIGQSTRPLRHESDLGRSGLDGHGPAIHKCSKRQRSEAERRAESMKWFVTIVVVLALRKCGGWSAERSAVDAATEAGSFRLQLQGRGNRARSTIESTSQKAGPAYGDSSAQGSAPCHCRHSRGVSQIGNASRKGISSSVELESASCRSERRGHQCGRGFAPLGDRRLDADAWCRTARSSTSMARECQSSSARHCVSAQSSSKLASISRASHRSAIPAGGRSRRFSPDRAWMKHLS